VPTFTSKKYTQRCARTPVPHKIFLFPDSQKKANVSDSGKSQIPKIQNHDAKRERLHGRPSPTPTTPTHLPAVHPTRPEPRQCRFPRDRAVFPSPVAGRTPVTRHFPYRPLVVMGHIFCLFETFHPKNLAAFPQHYLTTARPLLIYFFPPPPPPTPTLHVRNDFHVRPASLRHHFLEHP
jgi:hypothetical protein